MKAWSAYEDQPVEAVVNPDRVETWEEEYVWVASEKPVEDE